MINASISQNASMGLSFICDIRRYEIYLNIKFLNFNLKFKIPYLLNDDL